MIIQLSYNNLSEKIIIPVNPPKISVSDGGVDYKDIDIIKGGERTVIGDDKLSSVSFSSFFPARYDSSYCNSRIDPAEAVRSIIRWRASGQPVKLLITGLNINMYATIRSFNFEERGGEPGDIYYDLSLKQFIFIEVRGVVQSNDKAYMKTQQQSARPDTMQKASAYTVKSGESLWDIARQFYGSGSDSKKIIAANSSLIQNPCMITPGWRLIIP